MAHLTDRISLIPFSDLTDCPNVTHHAVGSPYFDAQGNPLIADPVVVAVRADIADTALPRSSALAVSCNTRPYQSYGPVIRRVFECSQPELHPELRRALEGVMELGEVRELPPGGLNDQVNAIFLACVATMTAGTNEQVLKEVMENIANHFESLPPGSTMRVPLIGTGKSRSEKATEQIYREVVDLTLSHLTPASFDNNRRKPPRRIMLIHPIKYEAQLIASVLAEKSIFLTILDKMGLATTDDRLVYGIAHGEAPDNQIVKEERFEDAINHFDLSLEHLLKGEQEKAIQEAARGSEVAPGLSGMFLYIHFLATKQRGLLEAITQEALDLASRGRIEDAFRVGRTLTSLGGAQQEKTFIKALRRCYVGYSLAELEAQLLYEKYMQAEEQLVSMREELPDAAALTGEFPAVQTDGDAGAGDEALSVTTELAEFASRIPNKVVENSFHVAVRKLLAEPVETSGVRRIIESLHEYNQHHDLPLENNAKAIAQAIHDISEKVDKKKHDCSIKELHRDILDKLNPHLGHHNTYRLEEARYHLRGSGRQLLTPNDMRKAWSHLKSAYEKSADDNGILSFIGFLMLLQGPKLLHTAETYFLLWAKLIERELAQGRYRQHRLEAPSGKRVDVPIHYPHAKKAHNYQQRWLEYVRAFADLLKGLIRDDNGDMLLSKYNDAIQTLGEIGRFDLVHLYEQFLGERWISLLVSRKRGGVKIPIPMVGEISLDLVINLYRRFRRWRLFRKLHTQDIEDAMRTLVEKMSKDLES